MGEGPRVGREGGKDRQRQPVRPSPAGTSLLARQALQEWQAPLYPGPWAKVRWAHCGSVEGGAMAWGSGLGLHCPWSTQRSELGAPGLGLWWPVHRTKPTSTEPPGRAGPEQANQPPKLSPSKTEGGAASRYPSPAAPPLPPVELLPAFASGPAQPRGRPGETACFWCFVAEIRTQMGQEADSGAVA